MPSRVISASTAAATSFCAALDLRALLRRRADDVEGAPGQHAGDGIEVGGIDIAAHARRLEGNRPAAAERVGELRPMAEARDAQLLDQFGQAERASVPRWRFTSGQMPASSSASSHSSGRRHMLQPLSA